MGGSDPAEIMVTNVLFPVPREFPPEGILQNSPVPGCALQPLGFNRLIGESVRQVRLQGGVGLLAVCSHPKLTTVQQSEAGAEG